MKTESPPGAKDWLFVDVGKKVPLARTYFDESEPAVVSDVVRSGWLCQGPKVAQFEAEFARKLGVKNAVAVANGSIALLVSLQALGVEAGDEYIVPNVTFVSSASSGLFLGARPVFCDINMTNYGLDPERIEALVTPRTKVILPVHFGGHTAEMDRILAIAKRHGLKVLEDAAGAHLSKFGGKYAGTIGDIGIFSFTPSKPMTTGEGGMIVTNNDDLAARARLFRNFGDTSRYTWDLLGFNFRLNEMAAAIGICQLAKLGEMIALRRQKGLRYNEGFRGEESIITPWARSAEDTNYQIYTLRLRLEMLTVDRDHIMNELADLGIATRLYHPVLHKQKVFAACGPYDDANFPTALEYEKTAVSLPIFAGLTAEEQDYAIDTVLKVVRRYRKG